MTARLLARGFNDHIRLHGPDGDYAGEAVETGDGHGMVVVRVGVHYGVRVERVQALDEPGPLTPGQCWAALKADLEQRIEADAAVMAGLRKAGDPFAAAAHGALVSANRGTLAKMQALEGGR